MKINQQWALKNWPIATGLIVAITLMVYAFLPRPTYVFYAFRNDSEGVFCSVNGKPLDDLTKEVPGLDIYASEYQYFGKEESIKIKLVSNGAEIWNREIPPGTYLINMSNTIKIGYDEFSYGRTIPEGFARFLAPSGIGVYRMGDRLDYLVVDFGKQPLHSISHKESDTTLRRRECFQFYIR